MKEKGERIVFGGCGAQFPVAKGGGTGCVWHDLCRNAECSPDMQVPERHFPAALNG